MSLLSGIRTGLLGYSLKKETLGEGLFFRETESFNWDVYVTDISGQNIAGIQNVLQNEFVTKYSGDVNVKVFNVPTEYVFPNDSVRVSRFNVQVDVRRAIQLTGSSLNTTYYNGITGTSFWNSYGTAFNNFSEEYDYSKNENGSLLASHSITFSLLTGDKNGAQSIASAIFSNSDDAGSKAPNTSISSFIGSYNLTSSGAVQQFYNESYDTLKNNYSFLKKVEYPPLNSEFVLAVKKNLKHTIETDNEGIVTVTENGAIKAKKDFSLAKTELDLMKANNNIYTRCHVLYNSFKNAFDGTATLDLINVPLKNETIYNQPGLTVEYTQSFSDGTRTSLSRMADIESLINVTTEENRNLNINNTYNITRLTEETSTNQNEAENLLLITDAVSSSNARVTSFYNSSEFYNPYWPTITKVKQTLNAPIRSKSFTLSFSYTNEPIYNITLNGILFTKLEYKITDDKPVDMVSEYKIVNRPTKSSVINYAYQTEKGTKTININALPDRFVFNNFQQTPPAFQTLFYPLYTYGIDKLLRDFSNVQALAFSYYLSDIKCSINSDRELSISLSVNYTIKKYFV